MNFLPKIAASSLILLLHATALSVDWAALDKALAQSSNAAKRESIILKSGALEDPDFKKIWQSERLEKGSFYRNSQGYVRSKVIMSGSGTPTKAPAVTGLNEISEAKKNPIYHDQGSLSQSSWIGEIAHKFQEWIDSLNFRVETPRQAGPSLPSVSPDFIQASIYIALAICAALIIKAIAPFYTKGVKKAKSRSGIISEDEAGLTLDEWLSRADKFIADGLYREAVRCLYVACLIRLDESNKLDLKSYETNWEHYRRFAKSKFSQQLDLKKPTEGFDQFWYGKKDCTASDANQFRAYYESVAENVKVANK